MRKHVEKRGKRRKRGGVFIDSSWSRGSCESAPKSDGEAGESWIMACERYKPLFSGRAKATECYHPKIELPAYHYPIPTYLRHDECVNSGMIGASAI